MESIFLRKFTVQGLRVRTCNTDEMSPARASLGALWADFGARLAPRMSCDAQPYGIYYRYESGARGAYDVLAGMDRLETLDAVSDLQSVEVATGPYLVFEAYGSVPQAVINAWERVWTYFADPQCPHRRAYTTDFEHYGKRGQVKIFIALTADDDV